MITITVRYSGKCAETGKAIPRGTVAMYDRDAKKLYALDSRKARQENTPNPDAWIDQALVNNYYR